MIRGKHLDRHCAVNTPRAFPLCVCVCVCVCVNMSHSQNCENRRDRYRVSLCFHPSFFIKLQPPYRTRPRTDRTHASRVLFSFYLGFKRDGRTDVSFSHTQSETSFPWSAVLSPPQGSGCRLVHSRMGMTSCLRSLLLMPPLPSSSTSPLGSLNRSHPSLLPEGSGVASHRTHTQQWRISVTFQTLENNDPVEEALHLPTPHTCSEKWDGVRERKEGGMMHGEETSTVWTTAVTRLNGSSSGREQQPRLFDRPVQ